MTDEPGDLSIPRLSLFIVYAITAVIIMFLGSLLLRKVLYLTRTQWEEIELVEFAFRVTLPNRVHICCAFD